MASFLCLKETFYFLQCIVRTDTKWLIQQQNAINNTTLLTSRHRYSFSSLLSEAIALLINDSRRAPVSSEASYSKCSCGIERRFIKSLKRRRKKAAAFFSACSASLA